MAADGGSVLWLGQPLTTPQKRIAGSSKMAVDGGSVLWLGQPLTTPQKRIAGSSKMAVDGGSVVWVGQPLTTPQKRIAGAATTEKETGIGKVIFLMIINLTRYRMFPRRQRHERYSTITHRNLVSWKNKCSLEDNTKAPSSEIG